MSAQGFMAVFFTTLTLSAHAAPENPLRPGACPRIILGADELTTMAAISRQMTDGLSLRTGQEDRFNLYRRSLFGQRQDTPAETQKHFTAKKTNYPVPVELKDFLKYQISVASNLTGRFMEVDSNLDYWTSLLGNDLETLIPSPIRGVLSNSKVSYESKVRALFPILDGHRRRLNDEQRDSSLISQALVDLVHTVGFNDSDLKQALQSEDAIDRIDGFRKIIQARDQTAYDLGILGGFRELLQRLDVENVSGLPPYLNYSSHLRSFEMLATQGPRTVKHISYSVRQVQSVSSTALNPNVTYFLLADSSGKSIGYFQIELSHRHASGEHGLKVARTTRLEKIPQHVELDAYAAIRQLLLEKGYSLVF